MNRAALTELALLFLRLGATAFGGPAAHLAMMEEEVVRRRQWISREKFVDLLAVRSFRASANLQQRAPSWMESTSRLWP